MNRLSVEQASNAENTPTIVLTEKVEALGKATEKKLAEVI